MKQGDVDRKEVKRKFCSSESQRSKGPAAGLRESADTLEKGSVLMVMTGTLSIRSAAYTKTPETGVGIRSVWYSEGVRGGGCIGGCQGCLEGTTKQTKSAWWIPLLVLACPYAICFALIGI